MNGKWEKVPFFIFRFFETGIKNEHAPHRWILVILNVEYFGGCLIVLALNRKIPLERYFWSDNGNEWNFDFRFPYLTNHNEPSLSHSPGYAPMIILQEHDKFKIIPIGMRVTQRKGVPSIFFRS